MHTTHADWRAVADCIGAGREAESIDDLLDALLPRLHRLFQAELVMWNTYEAASMGVMSYRVWPAIAIEHLFSPFIQHRFDYPLFSLLPAVLPRGHVSFLSDHLPRRVLVRTSLWNEVYIHLRSKHQISMGGPLDGRRYWTSGINRLARDFGPRDRELVHFMRPQLQTLLQKMVRRDQVQQLAGILHQFFAQGDNAYVWFNAAGDIVDSSPEARHMLGKSENQVIATDALPRNVSQALRRLRAPAGIKRSFVSLRVGLLDAVLLSLGSNDGALLFLQKVPMRPSSSGCQDLTKREAEVLHWLGEGKRNSEIAHVLGISPRTVGRHCENLFAKLGVESRHAAGLIARDYK